MSKWQFDYLKACNASNEEVNVLLLQKSFSKTNCSCLDCLLFMFNFFCTSLQMYKSSNKRAVEHCGFCGDFFWWWFELIFGLMVIIKWLMQILWGHFFPYYVIEGITTVLLILSWIPKPVSWICFYTRHPFLGYLSNLSLFPHGYRKNYVTFISLLSTLLLTQLNCYSHGHVWCIIRN